MNKGRTVALLGLLCLLVCLALLLRVPDLFMTAIPLDPQSPNYVSVNRPGLQILVIYIGTALISFIAGLILFGFGVSELKCRDRWLFWTTVLISLSLMFAFPQGTVAGIIALVFLLKIRKEFFQKH